MSVMASNFYRRPLPERCVDLASEEGKKLFTAALEQGHANIFFKLISQFRTQDEPSFCALSSLVMILNALEVDPQKVWRAPWRFYHETMLDCCVPLESVRKGGMTLQQVACLATCNRLNTEVKHAEDSLDSLAQFRNDVITSTKSSDRVILATYSRKVLGQTGDGHFSPLAAYDSTTDQVLLLDVARFKYPPHWVKVSLLHKSMCTVDRTSEKNRGYLNLSLQTETYPLLMFGLRASFVSHEHSFASSLVFWRTFLASRPLEDPHEEFLISCRTFSQHFSAFALCCRSHEQHCAASHAHDETRTATKSFEEACEIVCSELRSSAPAVVLLSSAAAALLFAWPLEEKYSERSDRLRNSLQRERKTFSRETENEISLLTTQLKTLINNCHLPPNI